MIHNVSTESRELYAWGSNRHGVLPLSDNSDTVQANFVFQPQILRALANIPLSLICLNHERLVALIRMSL